MYHFFIVLQDPDKTKPQKAIAFPNDELVFFFLILGHQGPQAVSPQPYPPH